MPRGGRRAGTPGKAYGNRSDLQVARPLPVQTATGQQYGRATEQAAAQRALPMSRPATDAVPPATPAPAGGPGVPSPAPGPLPGQVIPLTAPTQRPNEPLTAGLDVGAGPGREALGPFALGGEDVASQLRAIYVRFPNEDVRALLELLDDED